MTRKILTALDGSAVSESILPYVETLLTYDDANVTLARATDPQNPREGGKAWKYLKELARR